MSWFSASNTWVPETELKSSELIAGVIAWRFLNVFCEVTFEKKKYMEAKELALNFW